MGIVSLKHIHKYHHYIQEKLSLQAHSHIRGHINDKYNEMGMQGWCEDVPGLWNRKLGRRLNGH